MCPISLSVDVETLFRLLNLSLEDESDEMDPDMRAPMSGYLSPAVNTRMCLRIQSGFVCAILNSFRPCFPK